MAQFVNLLGGVIHIILLFWISESIGFLTGLNLLNPRLINKGKQHSLKPTPTGQSPKKLKVSDFYIMIKFLGLATLSTITFTITSIFKIPWWYVWFSLVLLVLLISIRREAKPTIFLHLYTYLKQQFVSFVIYLIMVLLRVQTPYFNQTERFMDSLFIYFIYKRGYLPLENPWLSGAVLNYYYLGHFLLAGLLKTLFIPPQYGYNLLVGLVTTWILQAFYQTAHLISRVVSPRITLPQRIRWFIALTFTLGGNFYILFAYLNKQNLWYPDASRVIPNTINEFPAYSIAVGDLHGHFVDLAFATVGILAIWLFLSQRYRTLFDPIRYSIALGTLLFQIFAANSWDIFPLIFASIMWAIIYLGGSLHKKRYRIRTWFIKSMPFLIDAVLAITTTTIPFVIFKLTFLPPVKGIGFKVHHDYKWAHILWGQHIIFLILLLLLFIVIKMINIKNRKIKNQAGSHFITEDLTFPVIIIFVGILNIVLVNFFFMKSIFYVLKTESYRANSVFKMYYTAWGFIGVPTLTLLLLLLKALKRRLLLLQLAILFTIIATTTIMWSYQPLLLEQAYGISSPYALRLKEFGKKLTKIPQSLDGTEYLKDISQADNKAKRFLQAMTRSKPAVLLEHTDWQSYKIKPARFCTTTGNVCILGWPLHNYQWYLSLTPRVIHYPTLKPTKTDITQRLQQIWRFYKAPNSEILRKYGVDYVILGKVEQDFIVRNGQTVSYIRKKIQELCPTVYEFTGSDMTVTYIFRCN